MNHVTLRNTFLASADNNAINTPADGARRSNMDGDRSTVHNDGLLLQFFSALFLLANYMESES